MLSSALGFKDSARRWWVVLCVCRDNKQQGKGQPASLAGEAFADGLEDGVVLNVVRVVGLELGGDTGQGALEGVLGGGVDHLGLKWVLGVTR